MRRGDSLSSSRYDLSKGQLSYPVLGLSVNGVALLLALSTFTFALIVVASSLSDIPSQRRAVVSLGASAGAALFVGESARLVIAIQAVGVESSWIFLCHSLYCIVEGRRQAIGKMYSDGTVGAG